ncbi:MAG TPA: DUF6515 family protein [Desulfobacteraceae bacterium]|nr:DUF6515 family protein [Desulfobacteraceae bacterium]HPJ66752.1 DUF6515 family protein [Desulfobacteraceae bacterium]HPQ29708.1 DUF6515 family protein [Desulfobacteraceae bacterium]
MFMQLRRKSCFFMILIAIFAVSLIMLTDDSFARHPKHRRIAVPPRIARPGHVVPRLPPGHRRVWHNRNAYFYHRGIFYRPAPSGFVAVRPPIGAVVVNLPVGFRRLWVGGVGFYVYGDVFYRRAPGGYAVVETPPDVIVEEESSGLVQPADAATGKVTVAASVLNVRSGPSLMHPTIYQIHEGYILEIHGKSDGWLYVLLPNGEYGWVMKEFTTLVEPPASG